MAAVAAVVVVLAVLVVPMLASRRPDVPLQQLLASGAAEPGNGGTDGWTMTADVNLGMQNGTKDNTQRIWKRPGGANIRQTVFRLGNPLSARSSYTFGSAKFDDTYQEVHPADDLYRSTTADRSQLVCGWGTVTNCSRWVYWAQYGQYLLKVEYIGGDEKLDAERFAEYVGSIDRHVASQLAH
jgi:hypothetical protein